MHVQYTALRSAGDSSGCGGRRTSDVPTAGLSMVRYPSRYTCMLPVPVQRKKVLPDVTYSIVVTLTARLPANCLATGLASSNTPARPVAHLHFGVLFGVQIRRAAQD